MIFVIYLAILISAVYATNYYVNRNTEPKNQIVRYNYLVAAILIALMYFFNAYHSKLYGDHIGSWFEKGEYSADYYVNLFEKKDTSKNYRVEALISRYEGEYILHLITWPNGGYITFDGLGYDYPLVPYQRIEIKDDDGKTWFVELTKEKVAPN